MNLDIDAISAAAKEWLTVYVGGATRYILPFLILSALMIGPVAATLMLLWVRSLNRALNERRQFLLVPTSRTEAIAPRHLNIIVRTIAQVRLRRRNAMMSPAGAVRVALTNANKLAVVHSMGGPPWMAGVLDVNTAAGLMVAPVELVDPAWISPKSILPPAWVDSDVDAPTVPVGAPTGPLSQGTSEDDERDRGGRPERGRPGAGTRETPVERPGDGADDAPPSTNARRRGGGGRGAEDVPVGATGLGLGVARVRRQSA